ncbi:hypothetical protein [Candidatus Anaplasma sp. TIGMIC]|uniref:hypothetical protein n=1 Tax=Candidatus Anaplasma sp. TIGMIC TaxID=3020713 RepID=UPI00232C463A|nr:hypothetical protein [Candidatus Anaplasma sp. TIGMIC]MDB1135361.1 hypothetical protein [Candidatus Anaplasma sp. TIGMIC]
MAISGWCPSQCVVWVFQGKVQIRMLRSFSVISRALHHASITWRLSSELEKHSSFAKRAVRKSSSHGRLMESGVTE